MKTRLWYDLRNNIFNENENTNILHLKKFAMKNVTSANEARERLQEMMNNVIYYEELTEEETVEYLISLIEEFLRVEWVIPFSNNFEKDANGDVDVLNHIIFPTTMALAFLMKHILHHNIRLQKGDKYYTMMKKAFSYVASMEYNWSEECIFPGLLTVYTILNFFNH